MLAGIQALRERVAGGEAGIPALRDLGKLGPAGIPTLRVQRVKQNTSLLTQTIQLYTISVSSSLI